MVTELYEMCSDPMLHIDYWSIRFCRIQKRNSARVPFEEIIQFQSFWRNGDIIIINFGYHSLM